MMCKRNKFWNNLLHGFVFGMRGGDSVLEQNFHGDTNNTVITTQKETDGVFNDLLQGKVTQEVVELRDKNYRVFNESGNYEVKLSPVMGENGEIEGLSVLEAKKVNRFDKPHAKIDESEGLKLRTIQFSSDREQGAPEDDPALLTGKATDVPIDWYIFKIGREDFTPRFYIERFIKKAVIWQKTKTKVKIDLYFSKYQRQFNKRDALFLNEIRGIISGKKSDIFDIQTFEFISDHAWAIPDGSQFKFKNLKMDGKIREFDGNYIVGFIGTVEVNGEYVGKEFETKELSKKYETEAPKENPGIEAVKRKVDREEKK